MIYSWISTVDRSLGNELYYKGNKIVADKCYYIRENTLWIACKTIIRMKREEQKT